MHNLDKILAKYEGRESELFAKLRRKYNAKRHTFTCPLPPPPPPMLATPPPPPLHLRKLHSICEDFESTGIDKFRAAVRAVQAVIRFSKLVVKEVSDDDNASEQESDSLAADGKKLFEHALMEGSLLKKGRKNKRAGKRSNWTTRYFTFSASDKTIKYFSNTFFGTKRQSMKEKGEMVVETFVDVANANAAKHLHRFDLIGWTGDAPRTLAVSASSAEEKVKWLEQLSAAGIVQTKRSSQIASVTQKAYFSRQSIFIPAKSYQAQERSTTSSNSSAREAAFFLRLTKGKAKEDQSRLDNMSDSERSAFDSNLAHEQSKSSMLQKQMTSFSSKALKLGKITRKPSP